jgi:hypothetical protein
VRHYPDPDRDDGNGAAEGDDRQEPAGPQVTLFSQFSMGVFHIWNTTEEYPVSIKTQGCRNPGSAPAAGCQQKKMI